MSSLRRSARFSTGTANVGTVKTDASVTKRRLIEGSTPEKATKRVRIPKAETNSIDIPFKVPKAPSTPLKKDVKKAIKLPPLTPTPSLVHLMRAPASIGNENDAAEPRMDRPVDPHISNATLVTPGGTQTVAFSSDDTDSSPTKQKLPKPTLTTGTLLEDACTHLIKVDPRIKSLVEKHRCAVFSPEGLAEEIDPFRSLASGIMGQQVSGAAAKSIKNKFVALFNEGYEGVHKWPSTAEVAATDIARLRLAGLSQRKAEYIQGLAQKFTDGELSTKMLMNATDEVVMEKLIAVRGLGKWSVEMFACFGLKRMDILSTGDLGVQRGMAAYFGKDVKKLKAKGGGKWKYMSEQEMLDKSAPYEPYRSLFMWYMWRVEEVDVDVMQNA